MNRPRGFIFVSDPVAEYVVGLEKEVERLRSALKEIASRPTVERNPDGDDQAAWTMQLIAREALGG